MESAIRISRQQEMQKRGFLDEPDPLRWITFNFGKKQFKEIIVFTEALLQKDNLDEKVKIIAEVYASISRAYAEDAPVEETIGKFLDEKECLTIKIEDMETEAHVYQMLGYVYGEHYKQYVKSVRCLNRAYRLGQDHAVLESLGCAYHLLAIHDALKEDHTIEMLEEITHFKNENIEVILAYLESAEHVKLQSPNFETQLRIRENVKYYEPCSTVAMAIEAEIPAVVGEPMLIQSLIDGFKNYIVRPDDLEKMMEI